MRRRTFGLLVIILFCQSLIAERVTVSVLATTDLHGNIYPIDYFTDQSAARGLSKIASLVKDARAKTANNLLIDCGDTIQGTPLEYVYQTYVRTGHLPLSLAFEGPPFLHDPMMMAMNHIGYDAMVVGNHEFNYGWKNLQRAREDARFPWISANTEVSSGAGGNPFPKYLLKTVAGVKIAVIGITTPAVPSWEKPENLGAYRFTPGKQAVQETMVRLRSEHPDLIIVAAHAGLDRDLKTGAIRHEDVPGENMVYDIATGVQGIDAIVFGHTHQELPQYRIGKVLLTQPKNWGMSLARLEFMMQRKPEGGWIALEKKSDTTRITEKTAADEDILRLAKPYHDMTQRYLNTAIAESPAPLDTRLGRVEDTPLVDAIHIVQMHYAKADVSFTSLFNPRVSIPKGPVTVRQIAALYLYDNELYAIQGDGRMVKDALENAARYFLSCVGAACLRGPLTNPRVIPFNYDMAEGVDYDVDLTQPEGQRIRNLRWKQKPLKPEQKLRVAVNNYRAGGSAGYSMFRDAKILWRSSEDIRQLMIDYFVKQKRLPIRANGNWHLLPPEALHTLEQQFMAEANRLNTQ
jgi:2',3'-cyclic-nucleotide 2'-phosphodiesterase/3'-nucleotidase